MRRHTEDTGGVFFPWLLTFNTQHNPSIDDFREKTECINSFNHKHLGKNPKWQKSFSLARSHLLMRKGRVYVLTATSQQGAIRIFSTFSLLSVHLPFFWTGNAWNHCLLWRSVTRKLMLYIGFPLTHATSVHRSVNKQKMSLVSNVRKCFSLQKDRNFSYQF